MPELSIQNKYKTIDIMHTDIAINEIKDHFEEGHSNALRYETLAGKAYPRDSNVEFYKPSKTLLAK